MNSNSNIVFRCCSCGAMHNASKGNVSPMSCMKCDGSNFVKESR